MSGAKSQAAGLEDENTQPNCGNAPVVCRYAHCKEIAIYVFLFLELRGLNPNFHIHVSVSDLQYIFPGSVHIFPAVE
jgi:hypothetical protein